MGVVAEERHAVNCVKRQEQGASVVTSWRVAALKEETETRISQERVRLATGLRP